MREESEEFKTTEEDNGYSGEPKKNEGHTMVMQQSIVTPTPPTSGNSGDMDFQRCHDLKFPNPLEHSSL